MVPIVMVVLDGAGDRPGRAPTPLEASRTPNLDSLVGKRAMGRPRACVGRRGGLLYRMGRGVLPSRRVRRGVSEHWRKSLC